MFTPDVKTGGEYSLQFFRDLSLDLVLEMNFASGHGACFPHIFLEIPQICSYAVGQSPGSKLCLSS